MESSFDYLRAHPVELGSHILETYPPVQSTKDPVATSIATLLRKALPAQALAITGTAKNLRRAKAARIVAECGAGKTYMALGTILVLANGRPSTTLVMFPSYITYKWAREVLLTIPRARAFLIENMRNGGDPSRQHGICEVKLSKVKTIAEQSQDDIRGQAPQPGRNAAHGPQRMAGALSRTDFLYHGQGQRQAGLLLGARLSQGKVRSESRRRHQSGFRRFHPRLRDAEVDRARLHRQTQGLRGADGSPGRRHTLFRAMVG